MSKELIQTIQETIGKTIFLHWKNPQVNIFDEFIQFCQKYYDGPAHTLAEIRLKNNTKIRGDVFEHFVLKYLEHRENKSLTFQTVWLLKDVPEDTLQKLGLRRNDLGIDLIAETTDKKYCAIQAKYRKRGMKTKHGIGWKQLSTFYALVNRTGPYVKHIVVTNADYVRHIGKKTPKDLSICYLTLKGIPVETWLKIADIEGQRLEESTIPKSLSTVEEIRQKRLAYYNTVVPHVSTP